MEARLGLLLFALCCGIVLAAAAADVADTEERESRSTSNEAAARRMDRQRAVQISACLQHVPDVGCDTFDCLKNLTCDIEDNLFEICVDYMQTAANFDLHGKRFTKDFMKCCALEVKSRFSSSATKCTALQRMLYSVQSKCYRLHNICPVLETNLEAFVKMVDVHKLLRNGAYVEYTRVLFDCGNKVIAAIQSHLQVQFGSSLPIFRQIWRDSCTRVGTTPATVSEDVNVNDESIQGGNWK